MKIGLKKMKVDILLFNLSYYPWLLSWLFTSTYYKDIIHPYGIINIWKIVGVIFIIFRFFIRGKVDLKKLLFGSAVLIIGMLVTYENGNASFVFYTMMLIVASRNIDVDIIIRNTLYCQIFAVLFTVISSYIGIIPNKITESYAGGFYRLRQGLGYTYTTFVPNYFLSILIEYLYLKIKKEKKWYIYEILVISVCNVVIYYLTKTRMAFYMVFIILILILVQKVKQKKKIGTISCIIYKWCFPFISILSILSTIFYNPGITWMYKINSLLSQRLRFAKMGILNWGVSLFGTDVEWNTASDYNYIDSSYINIIICYGIIVFIIVIVGMTIACRDAVKQQNKALCLALCLWAFKALIDPQLFLLWFNPFMFYIGKAYTERTFIKKKEGVQNIIDSMCVQQQRNNG